MQMALIGVCVCFLYLLLASLSSNFATFAGNVCTIWPASGLAVAVTLLFGWAMVPFIFAGSFLFSFSAGQGIPACTGIALAGAVETVIAVAMIRYFIGEEKIFDRAKNIACYLMATVGVAAPVASVMGVGALCLFSEAKWENFFLLGFSWWHGDVMGLAIVAPLILAFIHYPVFNLNLKEVAERVFYFAFLVLGNLAIFGLVPDLTSYGIPSLPLRFQYSWTFLATTFLLLPIFRWSPAGVMVSLTATSAIAITATLMDYGPFATADSSISHVLLSGFLISSAVVVMIPFSLILDRRRAERNLLKVTAGLSAKTEELERSAEELRRSNRELESFAYACSHDLKEPLRMISAYGSLIQKNPSGNTHEYISFVTDGAKRMSRLVDDLLAYSRTGNTKEIHLTEVRIPDIAKQVSMNLKVSLEDSHAKVQWMSMPEVKADPLRLALVFQNLISNAVKFRSPNRSPEIRISCESSSREYIFRVEDNGIGIESRYLLQIFEIFKRLHDWQKYPGSGIGLALCKRIVEMHGGRIWVESVFGRGSTFIFTLPRSI